MTFDHVRPGHFVPTATMQAGGGSLDWVSDVLARRDAGRFDKLVGASRQSAAAADGLCSCPTCSASARRTGTRTRAAASSGSRATTAARSSPARCWRASGSTCSPASRRSARRARSSSRSTRSAAARRATRGCRCWPTSGDARAPPVAGRRGQQPGRGRGGGVGVGDVRLLRRRGRDLRGHRGVHARPGAPRALLGAGWVLFVGAYERLERLVSDVSSDTVVVTSRSFATADARPGRRAARRRA